MKTVSEQLLSQVKVTLRQKSKQPKVQLIVEEEKVMTMLQHQPVNPHAALELKTQDPELLNKLKEIEAALFLQAGQLRSLCTKRKIIEKLKSL